MCVMGDETSNSMNLDLNLGPVLNADDEPGSGESMSLEQWLDRPVDRYREAFMRQRAARQRAGRRWRLWRPIPGPPDSRNFALDLIAGAGLEIGEGSVAAEDRPIEVAKVCDINCGNVEKEVLRKKEDVEKGNADEGSYFDCNICLDLAREPVVTCCGHLFCWPCLYRWLHLHSDSKECPICKGEVTLKNVTPIYGRGNSKHELQDDSSLKIPQRPQGRRVESWRQFIQRNAFTIPMEEMIQRLGNGFDLGWDLVQVTQVSDGPQESPERSNSLLDRFLASSGLRRENNTVLPSEDAVELSPSSPISSEVGGSRRSSPFARRRSHSHRAATIANMTSALSSAERIVESYFRRQPEERNQEQPASFDDRDSVSSIAAVIQSESQTVDTAAEIDSRVSLSTSSSRRRYDGSRISDVDSGDSRPPRRRRLN